LNARKCLLSAVGSEFSRLRSTGQRGTPRVHPTTARPMITVTADGAGVVSHVGSRLLAGMADCSGLTVAFSDALAGLRERRSAHDPGRVLTDLAVLLADGGRSISDLAVLRDQPTLFGSVASTATAWRVLDRIDPVGFQKSAAGP
jgi:Transposase DDE domain group 1